MGERRSRSAAPSEDPGIPPLSEAGPKGRPGTRQSKHRRARSAAPAADRLSTLGGTLGIAEQSSASRRPEEVDGRPPPRSAPAGAPRRRISEERRAKSALGMT